MKHKTFLKKDEAGKVLATVRCIHGEEKYLPPGFEEIEDNPDIESHTKYYGEG